MSDEPVSHIGVGRAYLAEALGTFALVLAGAGAIMVGAKAGTPDHTGISLTFGLVVMAWIYFFGGISGAHINPAVTIALATAGRFPWSRVVPYVLAQSFGAIMAGLMLRGLLGPAGHVGATLPAVGSRPAFVLEFWLTAFLMFAVMTVVTGPPLVQRLAGVIVGGVVTLEALWAGPLTGASMNPARSLGPALASGELGSLWIYLLAPVMGAVVAATCYRMLTGERVASGVRGAMAMLGFGRHDGRRIAGRTMAGSPSDLPASRT